MEDRPWYAHWPRGLPVSLDYPSVPVHVILQSAAKRFPDRPAIIFQVGEHTVTYVELWEKARRFAAALHHLGVRKGEVVAVHLPNSPQFAIVYYGLLMVGAVFSPCFPLLTLGELRHQLLDSRARTIVTLDMFMGTVSAIRNDTELRRVIVTGIQENLPPYAPVDVKPYGPRTYSLQQLLDETTDEPPAVAIDPDRDLAHLAYTGGTTGRAKGVMLTHKAVVANAVQYAHWIGSGRPVLDADGLLAESADRVQPEEGWEYPVEPGKAVLVVVVPWSHAMGSVGYLNNPVYGGTTMVVHPRFDAAAYAADIVKYRATAFGGAPALLRAVADLPDAETLDFSSVRYIASGAAPLPVEVMHRVQRLAPDAVLMEGYGLTEMAMGVTANPANRSGLRKPGSVGLPIFDTDVKIVDLDDPNIEIGFEEMGEICVRGPQMMLGYWQRPEETAQVMRGGWVHTGDIGWLDRDGYLFVSDRKKDMLLYNGFSVYPRELEEILRSHRLVADCSVIGRPDPKVGEIPKAFVVLKPGKTATARELMDFVNQRVAPYKKVREVEFTDAIPVSYAGKPLKRELRQREIERMQRQGQEEEAAEAGPR